MDATTHQVTLGLPNGQHIDITIQGHCWFWGAYSAGGGFAYGPFPTLAAAAAHVLVTHGLNTLSRTAPLVLILPLSRGLTAYTTVGAHRPAVRLCDDSDLVTLSISGDRDLHRLTECLAAALAFN
jgi:hypothetical protein